MSGREPSTEPRERGRGEGLPGPGSPAGEGGTPPAAALEMLAGGMEAGLVLIEVDGSIRFATPRARALLGIRDPDPPGRLPHLSDGNRIAGDLAQRILPEEPAGTEPRRHFLQLGKEGNRFLSITVSPLRSHGGRRRWAVLLEDVSGVIRKGQEAADWGRQLVHDLKSPLSSVTGAVDLIFSGRLGPVDQKLLNFLNILRKGADRMVEMLEVAGESRPSGTPEMEVVKDVSLPLGESGDSHGSENPGCR